MELPAMATEGLLEEEQQHYEAPIRNLDNFFASMYKYWNNKGLPTILLTETCAIISLGFTTGFSTFLIGQLLVHVMMSHHAVHHLTTLSLTHLLNFQK